MRFTQFRQHHELIRGTSSILAREALLGDLFSEAEDGPEMAALCAMMTGRISDPVTNLNTGIKEVRVAKFLGVESKAIADFHFALPEEPAPEARKGVPVKQFLATLVDYASDKYRSLSHMDTIMGEMRSMGRRDGMLAFEILCGKVSNGLDDLALLYALARWQDQGACMKGSGWKSEVKARLKGSFGVRPDIMWWANELATKHFLDIVDEVEPEPGLPVSPMLCERVEKLADVFEHHPGLTLVQPKLDGQRIQVHKLPDGTIRLFSRQLKDVTDQYPDIVGLLDLGLPHHLSTFILDGELVAVDENEDILPFAQLARRMGRKEGQEIMEVGLVLYDVMLLEGHSWMDQPYLARRSALLALLDNSGMRRLRVIDQKAARNLQELQDHLQEAADRGDEGLVVKRPEGPYEAGNRSTEWIKLKPEYIEGMGLVDSVDLVVVGFEMGRGKRHGKVGALWLATATPHGKFQAICKVGTGFTDEQLAEWTQRLIPTGKASIFPYVGPDMPDMGDTRHGYLIKPEYVVEIKASEVSTSPLYPGGISLRFPRYLRHRPDKTPLQATTMDEILAMRRQP